MGAGVVMDKEIAVSLSEDAAAVVGEYEGTRLEVPADEYARRVSTQGIPFSAGRLHLEYNRQLEPFRARGVASDVGEYFKLASASPMVRDAVSGAVSAITAAPWRLERPALPEYYAGRQDAAEALERQFQFSSFVWAQWTATGRESGQHWRDWINDILQFSLISGFYLGELVGEEAVIQVDGADRRLIVPTIPASIMPWTVREWVFSGSPDTGMLAIVQDTFTQLDSFGNAGRGRLVVPWEKLIHSAYMPASAGDLEGRSIIRPAFQPIKMKQSLLQLQSLGIELNSLGFITVKQDPQNPLSEDAIADLQVSLESFKAEQSAWLILPPGNHSVDFQSPSQVVPDLTNQLNALDGVIGKALGNSHKLMGISSHGSFAARSDASSEARNNYEHLGLYVSRVAEKVLRRFLALNFPLDAERGLIFTPSINHAAIVEPDKQRRASTLSTLAAAGLLEATPAIKRQLLEENNLSLEAMVDPES